VCEAAAAALVVVVVAGRRRCVACMARHAAHKPPCPWPLHSHTVYTPPARATHARRQTNAAAAQAILSQFERLPDGYSYFRLHPKGRGMLVARQGGLPAFTFVEEYFGQLHSGARAGCRHRDDAARAAERPQHAPAHSRMRNHP
jgi:hypothetical protein